MNVTMAMNVKSTATEFEYFFLRDNIREGSREAAAVARAGKHASAILLKKKQRERLHAVAAFYGDWKADAAVVYIPATNWGVGCYAKFRFDYAVGERAAVFRAATGNRQSDAYGVRIMVRTRAKEIPDEERPRRRHNGKRQKTSLATPRGKSKPKRKPSDKAE